MTLTAYTGSAKADAQASPRFRIELFELFRDRRFWRGPFVGVVVTLVLMNFAVVHWRDVLHAPPGARRGELGAIATAFDPRTRPIRFDWSIGDELARYERYIPDSRKTRLVILSGMSQMYTINEYKPGDETISEHMDDALASRGTRVFGLAAPNLAHEEALFLLLTTLRRPETTPNWFIFAVAFEKLREFDLRPRYRAYLVQHPEVVAEWRTVALRYRDKYPLATRKMLATLDEVTSKTAPGRKDLESRLRDGVGTVVPLVHDRKELNTYVQSSVFELRNWVFGINNMTKRPIIPERYDTNREFLGLLVDVAREHGVNVMLYIVPFNPRAENPYIPQEYAAFKVWLSGFCRQRDIPLANLENAVPAQDWGTFFGGPDFKHFKGEGHRKTADALLAAFDNQLAGGTQ